MVMNVQRLHALIEYDGYYADIETTDEDKGIIVGHIIGVGDIIGFHTDNLSKIEEVFKEAVIDYEEMCERISKPIKKPTLSEVTVITFKRTLEEAKKISLELQNEEN